MVDVLGSVGCGNWGKTRTSDSLNLEGKHKDSESSDEEKEGSLCVCHNCDRVLGTWKVGGYESGLEVAFSKLLEWTGIELEPAVDWVIETSLIVIYVVNQPLWLPVQCTWPVHSNGWPRTPPIRMDRQCIFGVTMRRLFSLTFSILHAISFHCHQE